jgi:cell shape-determining protein MreD
MRPNLILAAVVAATVLLGLGAGAVWAFVGGLSANLLTTDPLGTIPLGLLLVAGVVALLVRLAGRPGVLLALLGGLLGSVILDLVALGALVLEETGPAVGGAGSLVSVVAPTAILNAALAAGLFLVGRTAIGRLAPDAPPSFG